MERDRWLWHQLPPEIQFDTRSIRPDNAERAAVATAANHFAAAIVEFAQETPDAQDSPEDAARDMAAKAAVLGRYVLDTDRYINMTLFDADWDDESPELLRCREQFQKLAATSNDLTGEAKKRLEELGISLPRWGQGTGEPKAKLTKAEIEEFSRQYSRVERTADAAATIGTAAALNWILTELEAHDAAGETDGTAALVLAMWPNEEYLMLHEHPNLPVKAQEIRAQTGDRLRKQARTIEAHRPMFVSQAAATAWEDWQIQELVGEMSKADPQINAVFDWDDRNPQTAFMAYRYQGSTHVKMVNELYDHRVSIDDALEHWSALEILMMELRITDEPEGQHSETARAIMAFAAANRTKVLVNCHDDPMDDFRTAIEMALEHGRARHGTGPDQGHLRRPSGSRQTGVRGIRPAATAPHHRPAQSGPTGRQGGGGQQRSTEANGKDAGSSARNAPRTGAAGKEPRAMGNGTADHAPYLCLKVPEGPGEVGPGGRGHRLEPGPPPGATPARGKQRRRANAA